MASGRVGAVQLPAFGERIFDTGNLPPVVRHTRSGGGNPTKDQQVRHDTLKRERAPLRGKLAEEEGFTIDTDSKILIISVWRGQKKVYPGCRATRTHDRMDWEPMGAFSVP